MYVSMQYTYVKSQLYNVYIQFTQIFLKYRKKITFFQCGEISTSSETCCCSARVVAQSFLVLCVPALCISFVPRRSFLSICFTQSGIPYWCGLSHIGAQGPNVRQKRQLILHHWWTNSAFCDPQRCHLIQNNVNLQNSVVSCAPSKPAHALNSCLWAVPEGERVFCFLTQVPFASEQQHGKKKSKVTHTGNEV